jgi:beta-ribofuranosylaminobenzene 5'-phosphate synthase
MTDFNSPSAPSVAQVVESGAVGWAARKAEGTASASDTVCVRAPGRIHLGLLQLSGRHPVMNTGIGFALDSPAWILEMRPAATTGRQAIVEGMEGELRAATRQLLSRVRRSVGGPELQVIVRASIEPHVGLGAKTSLLCGVLAGACRLIDHTVDWRAMRWLTGRGGTSGIGINVAAVGGMVLDAGHREQCGPSRAAPSSYRCGHTAPMIAGRWTVPPWPVLIVRPPGPGQLFGDAERAVFDENVPVAAEDVDRAAGLVVYQLLPALARSERAGCAAALEGLQRCGFKRAEWDHQAPEVHRLRVAILAAGGECAALSSMGPSMAVLAADPESVADRLLIAAPASHVHITRASERGVEVRDTQEPPWTY